MAPAVVDATDASAAPEKLDRVKRNEIEEDKLADQYGAPDVYIDGEKV